MRPTDHPAPFDHELEIADLLTDLTDLTDEFWGTSRGWSDRFPGAQPETVPASDDTTGTIRAIRDGVVAFRPRRVELRDQSGQIRRTRAHGTTIAVPTLPRSQRRATATIGELAAGHFDDPVHEPHGAPEYSDDIPLEPAARSRVRSGVGPIDPLLARLGALVVVGVLLVPVALALRPSQPDPNTVRIESPTASVVAADAAESAGAAGVDAPVVIADGSQATAAPGAGETTAETMTGPESSPQTDGTTAGTAAAPGPTAAPVTAGTASAIASGAAVPDAAGDVAQSTDTGIAQAATVDVAAERVVPECPLTYVAGPGDSWYRIADAAGVAPNAVMAENRATVDTVILAGDEICLPSGATVPAQPTTSTAPPTTEPTASTQPATTVPSVAPASVEEVKQLIRDTWPADQHETALRIAERESKFDPLADNNFCCYGVFQIYFEVHKGWLDDFGVYTASDLFDAEKNIAAAYHLYERAGGWGPWGL